MHVGGNARGWRREGTWAAALCAFVITWWSLKIVFNPVPAPRLPTWDLRNYYLPLYELTFDWLAAGRLPLWNPYLLTGVPWLATLQTGVFYPPHLVYLLLPTHTGFALLNVGHLLLAALGTFLFARRLGLVAPAAALGGALFAVRGSLHFWLRSPSALEAAAWLPLGAVAVYQIANGGGRRHVAALAIVTAMSLLAGYPQVTVYALYAWGLLGLALALGARPRRAAAGVAATAAAVLLGAGLSAVQTLPTAALSRESTRATAPLPEARIKIPAQRHFFALGPAISGNRATSFGAIVLALGVVGVALPRRRTVALWALLLGSLSYVGASARGETVLEVYRALPGVGWFRYPIRMLVVTQFCVDVLAALGLDALVTRLGTSGTERTPRWRELGAPMAAAALVALGTAELLRDAPRPGRLPYGVDEFVYYHRAPAFEALRERAGEGRVAWLTEPPYQQLKLAPQAGVRLLHDYEPMSLARHARYFQFLRTGRTFADSSARTFAGRTLPKATLRPRSAPERTGFWSRRRLLDLAAVTVFAADANVPLQSGARILVKQTGSEPELLDDGITTATTNPHALPRAYVTYGVSRAPDDVDALLEILAHPDFDPLVESFVEGDGFAAPNAPPRGSAARIVRDEPTLVEVAAVLDAPGLLVLADTYAAGWRASVDGKDAAILATNHLYRGVRVPPGSHRLRFSYRAPGLAPGAAISIVCLAILALLLYPRFRAG